MIICMVINYSKNQINRAGVTLSKNLSSENYDTDALNLLNFWRRKHDHPLQAFRVRLTKLSKKIDPNSTTGFRLKKRNTTIGKLKRFPRMKLTRMQDLAGCRIVLSDITLIEKMSDRISKRTKSELIKIDNHITTPKHDGYRSLHLIYKYKSKLKKKSDGALVEIQLRTKLQHMWATAVETVDTFTNQSLKTDGGEEQWSKFFKLVSSAFALMENSTIVPDTPTEKKILYSEIRKLERTLNAINLMKGWTTSVKNIGGKRILSGSYLLLLDPNSRRLIIYSYTKKQSEQALEHYISAENDSRYNVVLIKSEKIGAIKKMYPNYFADSRNFISKIKEIIE